MDEHHKVMGEKVTIYRRGSRKNWQCSAWVNGKHRRKSTSAESLSLAKEYAEDWYLGLMGKRDVLRTPCEKTFREVSVVFLREYEAITEGERSPKYTASFEEKLRVHLLPFFGDKYMSEITPGLVQEYRVHRMTSRIHPKTGQPMRPARSTLRHEIVIVSHILKTAHRKGWLAILPDISEPYKASMKVSHRAWFSPLEYKTLYEATRERAKHPVKEQWREQCERLHDYVLFMANTGLRPDEASRLQFRDVAVVFDKDTNERILEIEVRGKRGTGVCKSMPGAVLPFRRLCQRHDRRPGAAATDLIFGRVQRELFNAILNETGLKFDREGRRRTAYSLRHSYICFRLMEKADIYALARNCRTSVEMIQKHYAAHIKNMIDASAINVRRTRPNGVNRAKEQEDNKQRSNRLPNQANPTEAIKPWGTSGTGHYSITGFKATAQISLPSLHSSVLDKLSAGVAELVDATDLDF